MSALAWLFGLGVFAVAFPFLFHLIRPTPKGQTEFSSLMFLKPTPPKLTRRSRLENLLLLLLRAAAICLIAFAFMRPFFRGADSLANVEIAKRRVAILVDISASMRRAGLWDQTKQKIDEVLNELESGDDVALFAFSNSIEQVVGFEEGLGTQNLDPAQRIRDGLKTIEPGWQRSDLGRALLSVADQLDVWRDSQRVKDASAPAKLQIVVVSDLQKGSKLDALQSYQWPAHVFVKFNSIVPADYSNATVQLLEPTPEEDDPAIRVRVANSEESSVDQFQVRWAGAKQDEKDPISFYVPAGASHVLKVSPEDAMAAEQFSVTGDTEDFDNTFFVVPTQQQVLKLAYVGADDGDDADQPKFYLQRALVETPSRLIELVDFGSGKEAESFSEPASRPAVIVLTSPPSDEQRDEIESYLKSGGTLVVALSDSETVEATSDWTSARLKTDKPAQAKSRDNYQMLAEIDFSNAVFQPFLNPRYNDFTKIRFWQHQPVELIDVDAQVVARFENDNPAIWSRSYETGRVITFASGWQPSQSQLALSSKFVPLMNGLVELAADLPEFDRSILVGDRIEFPTMDQFSKRRMVKPDGSHEVIEAQQTQFDDVDQPGIYRLELSAASRPEVPSDVLEDPSEDPSEEPMLKQPVREQPVREQPAVDQKDAILFAVNVDRSESETAAIPVEQIEMFSVKVGEQETAANELAQMREMRDRDIENQQKVWKWLLVAALVFLIVEILLAGRTQRKMDTKTVAGNASSNGIVGEPS